MIARPVASYARMVRALADADRSGRALMVRLAAAGSGREALAVYLASEGTDPAAAAEIIGCDVSDLDTVIETFNAGTLAAIADYRAGQLA